MTLYTPIPAIDIATLGQGVGILVAITVVFTAIATPINRLRRDTDANTRGIEDGAKATAQLKADTSQKISQLEAHDDGHAKEVSDLKDFVHKMDRTMAEGFATVITEIKNLKGARQ